MRMMPSANKIIREQDPLKQGLKLKKVVSDRLVTFDSRARSTKTRIETSSHSIFLSRLFGYSRARSTKTRIETGFPAGSQLRT